MVGVINAVHAMFYSEDPPVTRAFFRDVLGWPFGEPQDMGFEIGVTIEVPAAGQVLLYQPSYPPSHGL